MIEADPTRFLKLQKTYRGTPNVACVHALVDDKENNVASIVKSVGFTDELDSLSIDIDGEDFYAFSCLDARPRLICVEVNAGHSPSSTVSLPREMAAANIGQPLQCFVDAGTCIGYRLICYNGNAFFLKLSEGFFSEIPTLTAEIAYRQYLSTLDRAGRRWMYMVNKGWVDPWFRYENHTLTAASLEISRTDQLRSYLVKLKQLRRGFRNRGS